MIPFLIPYLVYINASGFIKINTADMGTSEHYVEVLDATRIHPENYTYARKMAKDSNPGVDDDDEANDDDGDSDQMAVDRVYKQEGALDRKTARKYIYEKNYHNFKHHNNVAGIIIIEVGDNRYFQISK